MNSNSHKTRLIAAISLTALGIATASAASAQDAATDDGNGIQEIVVTAQKRQQSGQDVGIALSVVSADALAQRNVTSVTDLTGLVPNVQANYGVGQVAFNVRGIGTNEFSANFDSPVALNVDEVYLSKNFMSGLLLFDIDRVEALKGPQGTLFGRNATGGTVNFFTRGPTDTLAAGGTVSYDNYETIRAEAYISGPLGGGLSARLSGMVVDQNKGFYRNLTLGRREGIEKKWALRGQIKWTDGVTTALLSLTGGEQRGELQPYEGVGIFTPASVAAGAPVFCAPYLNGTVRGDTAGCVRGTDGGYPGDGDPYTSTNDLAHKVRNKSLGATLRIEHDFGASMLTSLTSYQFAQRRQLEDSDGSPVRTIDVQYDNRIRQISQEIRLSSTGSGPWSYVVGGYYEHDGYRNGDYLFIGAGAAPGYYSPFTQKVDALAAFFHNNVALTDTLGLVAGVRYSRERVSFDGGTFAATGLAGTPFRPTALVAPLSFADTSRKDDDATFKAGVEWKPRLSSDLIDKLLIYANVSTGFRSGSFNGEFAASQAALTSLAPEKITAYEAGFKSSLADRTVQLNASVFHYSFTDGFINVDSATSPLPVTINAAGISSYGVEADLSWRPIRQLTLSMGGGWLDSKIDSDVSVNGRSLKGARTIQSPRWTYNVQGSFIQPVGGGLSVVLSGDANYRSSQYYEVTNSINSREPGYWIVNGRIALNGPDDRWSLALFGKNLTKTVYRTYVNDLPDFGWLLNIYGQPRTYGLSASIKL
jgi:iron complex outermembrane receptor protein